MRAWGEEPPTPSSLRVERVIQGEQVKEGTSYIAAWRCDCLWKGPVLTLMM